MPHLALLAPCEVWPKSSSKFITGKFVFGLVMPRSSGPKTRRAAKSYLQAELLLESKKIALQNFSGEGTNRSGRRGYVFLSFCELTSRAGEVVNLTNLILQQPRANGFIIPGTNEDIPAKIMSSSLKIIPEFKICKLVKR